VKAISVLITMVVAIVLQMTLARYTIGGRWTFDLVLVGVLYAALVWGATAGILAGTLGGLVQDALSGGTLGVDGLSKTIVGFGVGVIGAQFVVTRPAPRVIVVAGATVVHRGLVLGLQALIDQRWSGVPWMAILGEIGLNGLAALVAFYAAGAVPGAWGRRRSGRRSGFARREW
jgi:rod shape-determining protein MreD